LAVSGCETSQPEPSIDYSQEGPNGPDAQSEFTKTGTGLEYKILRQGTGKKPTPDDFIRVSYRGWLDDGSVFDSSYERGKPLEHPLGQLVPGWIEGLQFLGEGGKIELAIPPELGYGERGSPPVIPPNARLHFIVELHQIAD